MILNERYLDEERFSGGIILLFVGISFISVSEIPFRIIENKERHKKKDNDKILQNLRPRAP
jgi:hypothetical protein